MGFGSQGILVPVGAVASAVSLVGAAVVILWLVLGGRRSALVSCLVVGRELVFMVVWTIFSFLFLLDPGQSVAWIWD